MSETSKNSCNICEKIGLKPFTKDNVLHHYIPLTSLVSYGALGVNILHPNIIAKLVPKKDVTNVLLMSTIFGTSLFIYNRPHLASANTQKKAAYSLLGGVLFSMGSILVWAIIKRSISNDNVPLATVLGLGSGVAIVKLGSDYLSDCDKLVK